MNAFDRIGFDDAAQDHIVEQGLPTMDSTLRITDEKVAVLCKMARKEGAFITFDAKEKLHAL